jgi:ribosome-binding factor A
MSNRIVRINELVQRELNAYLRKRYQSEAAAITIASVEIAPDLKTGKVFVSILGSEDAVADRMAWLRRQARELRREVGRHVVIKWTPLLEYVLDDSPVRATRVMQILYEIEQREKAGGGAPAADVPPLVPAQSSSDMGGTPMPRGTGVPPVISSEGAPQQRTVPRATTPRDSALRSE